MPNAVQFSDVQLLNLSFLLAIQSSIRKDPISACYKFKLPVEHASKLTEIPPEKIQSFVANLGHESVFTLRQDLMQLLETPPGLLRPLSTVHVPEPESGLTPPADRRASART
ncbi:flagellar transcriptional regulator FlhD [Herbaspirillum sp. ST 5-3]|uniref:flagellar transcriptional regulator FlhD n=1 Tax=Oxalobacteraceae TaxID=75682 RepID=UPI0010A31747|nr:flagellar transcriptional regulator FlhD [Herbaspirillum sp. ST 5-3]